MRNRYPSIRGFLDSRAKRLAVLWAIERTDGVTLRFTNHNGVIEFEGETFTPAAAPDATARRAEAALKESNVDFRGVVDSSLITVGDLRSGLYRDAKVTEIIVDWRYPYNGALARSLFWIEQTVYDSEVWRAELGGPQRFARRKIGAVFTRTCHRELYDSECGVNKAANTVTGVSVLALEDGPKKTVIFADPATISAFSDGTFAYGELTFSTGANAGYSEHVKAYRASDRRIELQGPMPFEIAVGDTFEIVQGCDKLATTCDTKFSNLINFGGFLFMPGTDRVITTPSIR